jgi:hypothetical protein
MQREQKIESYASSNQKRYLSPLLMENKTKMYHFESRNVTQNKTALNLQT